MNRLASYFLTEIIDQTTDNKRTKKTINNEINESMWIKGDNTIFRPMKVSINANPYFSLENM